MSSSSNIAFGGVGARDVVRIALYAGVSSAVRRAQIGSRVRAVFGAVVPAATPSFSPVFPTGPLPCAMPPKVLGRLDGFAAATPFSEGTTAINGPCRQ